MTLTPAPLWRRFAAMIYDSFILMAISMLYGGLTAMVYVLVTGEAAQDYQPMMRGPLFQLGWFVSLASFYVFFWYRAGQTVGMRAWRLKLVHASEKGLSLKQCCLRALLAPLGLLALGIGYFWAWLDPKGDCLHDKLSSTRVLWLPKK